MIEPPKNWEELENFVRTNKECYNIEWKEKIHDDDIVESIVGFANNEGGIILIGIKRDGTLVGSMEKDGDDDRISKRIQKLLKSEYFHVGSPLPRFGINIINAPDNRIFVVITVEKGLRAYMFKGVFYEREGNETKKLLDYDEVCSLILKKGDGLRIYERIVRIYEASPKGAPSPSQGVAEPVKNSERGDERASWYVNRGTVKDGRWVIYYNFRGEFKGYPELIEKNYVLFTGKNKELLEETRKLIHHWEEYNRIFEDLCNNVEFVPEWKVTRIRYDETKFGDAQVALQQVITQLKKVVDLWNKQSMNPLMNIG